MQLKYAFHLYAVFVAVILIFVSSNAKCYQLSVSKFGADNSKKLFKLLKISGFVLIGALLIKLIVVYLGQN